MDFYLDTGNVEAIKEINRLGLVDGVTTNPSLIAKEGRDFQEVIQEIAHTISGPVNAEVLSLEAAGMIEEGRKIAQWHPNVVVKIPMSEAGLEAVNQLSKDGIKTNMTLIFSISQGLMAAKAGATYVSPFLGRLDDIGVSGMDLIADLKEIFWQYDFPTKIIAASIRHVQHVQDAALVGADIATIPSSLFAKMWHHPLTESGITDFMADWKKFEEKQ